MTAADMEAGAKRKEVCRTDVLVIGGGQAGLAASHGLAKAGINFLVVDAALKVGDSWRQRYDSLALFTPRSISSLPGMVLPGDPEGYATKDEFADYLIRYAAEGGFDLETGTRIVRLRKLGRTFEAVSADGRSFVAEAVIVATGAFQNVRIPSVCENLPPEVQQMHVADFRNASSVIKGPVLVVGDGASGRDAALALAAKHTTALARGRPRQLFPERILGRSTWWWLQRVGLLRAAPGSLIGRRMRRIDPFPERGNGDKALSKLGIIIRPRLTSVEGGSVVFSDGSRMDPKAVVWATGFAEQFNWIDIEGASETNGRPVQWEGVSPVPGLYFVGRPWQRNRASALIAGAGEDAAFVVERLRKDLGY